MAALPNFAGTVNPGDLLTKLDAQRGELDARQAALTTAVQALQRGVQPLGGINVQPVDGSAVHTYSDLATAWTGATVAAGARLTLPSQYLDGDGYAAVGRLAGTNRFAILQPSNLTTTDTTRWRVTIVDVAADGSTVTQVMTGTFKGGAISAFNGLTRYIAASIVWSGPNTIKVQTDEFYNQNGSNNYVTDALGRRTLTTLTLDFGASSFTAVDDTFFAMGVRQGASAGGDALGTRHMRRSWLCGTATILAPLSAALSGSYGPGFLLSERAGSGAYSFTPVSGQSAGGQHAVSRLDGEFWAFISDARTQPTGTGYVPRLSLVRANDAMVGAVSAKAVPQALQGNLRLFALSANLMIAGWTTAGAFNSYVLTRDTNNGLAGAEVAVGTNEQGIVPFDIQAFSPTKGCALRISSGRTMRGQMFAVDTAVQAPGNPFTNGASFTVDLTTGVAASAAADNVVIGATHRVAANQVLVVSRNATRSAATVEVVTLTGN